MYHFVQYLYHFNINLLLTLVVPSLDLHNIFMVLLMFALGKIKIGAIKPIFLDSGSPRGRGVRACVDMVCYHCIVYILNSRRKLYFLCF